MPDTDRLLISVKEAAERLSLTPWSVYKLLDADEIKSAYQGRRRYVLVSSLAEYVDRLPTEKSA